MTAFCAAQLTAFCAWRRNRQHRQDLESRALKGDLAKAMMGTILAYITFGGSMFGAVYLLLHDKPIQSLAALIVALGSAFGPKNVRRLHPTQTRATSSTAAGTIVTAWRAITIALDGQKDIIRH